MPELGETSLRSLSLGVESLGDTTDLGLHSGVDDYNSSSTFCDLRSGEDETDSVTVVSVSSTAGNKMTHPTGQSSSSMGSSCLATGSDSPVRKASSHSRLLQCPSMIRPSAGTMSPFLSRTISPGTTSATGIVLVAGPAPSPDRRTTVACGAPTDSREATV